MKKFILFIAVLTVLIAACAPVIPENGIATPVVITAEMSTVLPEIPGPPPTTGPSPTPIPATPIPSLPTSSLSPTELKYRVLEQFPDFFFCDPDFYPIAREDEMTLALARFPELQASQEEFQAILSHTGLSETTAFTDDQKLLIYREHKKLNAIFFELVGDRYQFQIQTGLEGQQGSFLTGTIEADGSIDIQKQEPGFPTCPICLSAGTLIDTPRGAVHVEILQAGDQVWTMNEAGERVSGMILQRSYVPVPANHQIIHVLLNDGRELWASAGHPTSDGRMLGDLMTGDFLDGARIVFVEFVPYEDVATFDVLPSGNTGFYWANGILMGSTLSKP